jgi:hypothetical protein
VNKGTIRYSPKLLGASSSKWWVVIDCDPELGRYYRHLFHLDSYRCNKLQRPAWECHITVVRDEEPPNKLLWEKYDGLEVDFEIVGCVETNGDYYWFPIKCQQALDLRIELGLGEPLYPLHVSIGRH